MNHIGAKISKNGLPIFYIGFLLFGIFFVYNEFFYKYPVYLKNSKNIVYLTVGSEEELSYTKYTSDAQAKISHSSNDPFIATVDNTGKITANKAGTVTIETKVVDRPGKDKVEVIVTDVPVLATSIQSSKDSIQLNRNSQYQLTYHITPSNATNTKLYYTSSNPDIVSVTDKGIITGIRNGSAKIYTSLFEHNYSYVNRFMMNQNNTNHQQLKNNPLISETVVEVVNFKEIINVERIKASVENTKLFVGDKTKITYEVIPRNATNQNVIYKSSDTSVAYVTASGEVVAKKIGTTRIDVISNDNIKKTSLTIKVVEKQVEESGKFATDKIAITINNKILLPYETNASGASLISDDVSIVSISENKEIVARKVGTTKVKLLGSKGQVLATIQVEVKSQSVAVEQISFDKKEITLKKGNSKSLSLKVMPSNATTSSISYKTSNPGIITVTNSGTVTAKKGGVATITAYITSNGITKTTDIVVRCDVKVSKLTSNYGKIDMTVGESKTFKIGVEPSDASNKRLKYKINNPNVASIDENGKVIGKSAGGTTIVITPRDGSNKFITVPITIRNKPNVDGGTVNDDYHDLAQSHPRIGATKNDFERLQQSEDAYLIHGKQEVIGSADRYLSDGVVTEKTSNGKRIAYKNGKQIDVRTYYLSYFETLAAAYKLTNDSKYSNAGRDEMLALSRFQNWNFADYLNDAGVIIGVSTGFDWFYDILSENERKIIASAIYHYGISKDFGNYDKNITNWNTVIFSSVGVGTLAIYNEPIYTSSNFNTDTKTVKACKKECDAIVVKSVNALQSSFAHNGSIVDVLSYRGGSNKVQLIEGIGYDGYHSEGFGYWAYAMNYMTRFLSSLNNTLSNDYGFSDKEAIRNTVTYPIYMTGVQVFNYADAMLSIPSCNEAVLWLANQYDNKDLYHYYNTYLKDRYTPLSILWYQPLKASNATFSSPLDKFYLKGEEDVAIMRSQQNIKDTSTKQTYLAIKGGYNYTNHGDLDIGSFVMDAMGVRFIYDTGRGNYSAKNYFNRNKNAVPNRYMYYPKRADGNNTLVVNPDSNSTSPDQDSRSVGKIIEHKSNERAAYAVIDMTDAYKNKNITGARRAAVLHDNRSKISIVDEITTDKDTTIYWQVNIPNNIKIWYAPNAKITLAAPNGVNSKGKPIYKTVDLNIACSGSSMCKQAVFEVVPQLSLVGQLQSDAYRYIYPGYTGNKLRIKITLKAKEKLNLTVHATPNYNGVTSNLNKEVIGIDTLKTIIGEK